MDLWEDKQAMGYFKANLQGKALYWFGGAEGNEVKTKEDFVEEFGRIFGINIERKNVSVFNTLSEYINLDRFEEYVYRLRETCQGSTMTLKDIIAIICKKLPSFVEERLSSVKTWSELCVQAVEIEKMSLRKNRNETRRNVSDYSFKKNGTN